MKELSIEQKAQRYDEALEKARQLCAYPTTKPFISDLQDIFTELAESEDEEIRKEMIDFTIKVNNGVTSILANNYDFNKWRAWLEKQGKKDEKILILKDQIESLYAAIKALKEAHKIELEKQGEQKPVISYDALREGIAHFGITQYQIDNWLKKYVDVEKQGEQSKEATYTHEVVTGNGNIKSLVTEKVQLPNFKIGDTIVEKDLDECGYGTIKDIKDGQYIFTDGSAMNINEQGGWQLVKSSTNIEQKPVQEIEPAPIFKIGDILKRKGKDYTFRVDRIQGGYYHCDRNHGAFFPIEEQGNWELVEQKSIEWSEEDKRIKDNCISFLGFNKEYSPQAECIDECINWLKSLRPQSQWRSSDEQITWLYRAADDASKDSRMKQVLNNLLSDLKKLREE